MTEANQFFLWPSGPSSSYCALSLLPQQLFFKAAFLLSFLQDIEDLVARILVDELAGRSEIGILRKKCDKYDRSAEKWKAKAQAFQKQLQDLNQVMKKYITDAQRRESTKNVVPIKITRSVGLQVKLAAGLPTANSQVSQILKVILFFLFTKFSCVSNIIRWNMLAPFTLYLF